MVTMTRGARILGSRMLALVLMLLLAMAAVAVPGWAMTAATGRISMSSAGAQGDLGSYDPSISADGRFVAFSSDASNLVGGDTNGDRDLFVRDRMSGATRRVSVSSAGVEGNSDSYDPSISADGRFVAFDSYASNLVGGDTNATLDVFIRDLRNHTTRRVSVSSAGIEGNSDSYLPSISADGRFVAFDSFASDLITDDTNGAHDIFIRDLRNHTTRRVSVSSAGIEGDFGSYDASISADGRSVAFDSDSTNLVEGDTNDTVDVFVRDRRSHTTRRVSVSSAGVEGNADSSTPSISADGRSVAFESFASNLVGHDTNGAADVFVQGYKVGTTRRVSVSSAGVEGDSDSYLPSISADGRFVAFYSGATNLVGGDANDAFDNFVRDMGNRRTRRISMSSAGVEGDAYSYDPSISADGRFVAFYSDAANLVGHDTNDVGDVFIRGPLR
jgi:Tol biopolymer transport system component